MQHKTNHSPSRRVRRRGPLVALTVVFAAVAGACTPGGGGFNIAYGGTIPLPPIAVAPAFQGGNVLGCQIGFNTPGFNVNGATATIPGINVDLGAGTITVPNITVHLPAIQVVLPSLVTCLGNIDLGVITLPADVAATGVFNVATFQLTITATVTIPIVIFGVTFPVVMPLPPIVVQL